MPTYAAALAYRGLFALFPFMLLLVVLVGIFGPPDAFGRLVAEVRSQSVRAGAAATRAGARAGQGADPTPRRDSRAGAETGERRVAPHRYRRGTLVHLGPREHPRRRLQHSLRVDRNPKLVEGAGALSGLRSHRRYCGDRRHCLSGHRIAGNRRRGTGVRAAGSLRLAVRLAALPRGDSYCSGWPYRSSTVTARPLRCP